MPKLFYANSTIKQPRYKPAIVDKNRNQDASCTVCIPFTADIVMGHEDRVASIDCLSLLAGSSTFNKFAAVFDEFKIQKYHCCIDLTKPCVSTVNATMLFSPLDWNGPWKNLFKFRFNGGEEINASSDQFFVTLGNHMLNMGIVVRDHSGDYVRNYDNTIGKGNWLIEFLYQLLIHHNVAIQNQGLLSELVTGVENEHIISVGDGLGSVKLILPAVNDIRINGEFPNYQIIGACALRQVPKGYYGSISSDDVHRNVEIPNYYIYNDVNAAQPVELTVTDEEIESVGNYIHDSYMPGTAVHLSLEVNGTSATEKSMYLPTSVICNISQVDSLNQMGRFLPVGILQNKVRYVNGRDLMANGVFFETYVSQLYDNIRRNNQDMDDINVLALYGTVAVFRVVVGDNTLDINVPLYVAPLKQDVSGHVNILPDGPYTVLGYEGKTGDLYGQDIDIMDFDTFETHMYENVMGGSLLYNALNPNMVNSVGSSSSFSIQCYITVRLRNVRNLLNDFKVIYPYCISDCNMTSPIEVHAPVNVVGRMIGHSKGLVKMTYGQNMSVDNPDVADLATTVGLLNLPLKIIRIFNIGDVKAYLCHKYINSNGGIGIFSHLDDGGNAVDDRYKVLYGFVVQMNPKYPQLMYIFNCFSLTTRFGINEWMNERANNVQVQQPADAIFHLVYVAIQYDTYALNSQPVQYDALPGLYNGYLTCDDWSKVYWGFYISRMRSYGLCDGVTNNTCIEINCSPDYLNKQANCKFDLSAHNDPNYSSYALGNRVGTWYNPVSNFQV